MFGASVIMWMCGWMFGMTLEVTMADSTFGPSGGTSFHCSLQPILLLLVFAIGFFFFPHRYSSW